MNDYDERQRAMPDMEMHLEMDPAKIEQMLGSLLRDLVRDASVIVRSQNKLPIDPWELVSGLALEICKTRILPRFSTMSRADKLRFAYRVMARLMLRMIRREKVNQKALHSMYEAAVGSLGSPIGKSSYGLFQEWQCAFGKFLKPQELKLLECRFIKGMNAAEMAVELNMTRGAVYKAVHRILIKMRTHEVDVKLALMNQ